MQQSSDFIASLDRMSRRLISPNGAGAMTWRIWGEGRPLVLLHGAAGSWTHWIRNIEALSPDFMLIVPDLPGSGDSDEPTPPATVRGIAETLHRGLASIIGTETPFLLSGFSMGGLISAYLAQICGERVPALLLIGSTGTEAPRPKARSMQSWRNLAEADEYEAHRRNLAIDMIHDPDKIDDLAVFVQQFNARRSRVRLISHTGTLSQSLPGYQGALCGIWGERDATAAPYLAERGACLQQLHPGAGFEIAPNAGHWVQYEAHEALNARLRDFFAHAG